MQRRVLLKNIGLFTAGAMFLPGCDFSTDQESLMLALNNLQVSPREQDLMTYLVQAIIPSGDTPGAIDLKIQDFVWVMADDCLEKEDQDLFMTGLNYFPPYVEKFYEKSLEELTPEEKVSMLMEISQKEVSKKVSPKPTGDEEKEAEQQDLPPEEFLQEIQYFIQAVKGFTIRGYLYSEYVMTQEMPYQLVPKTYKYCESIDPSQKVNIHA